MEGHDEHSPAQLLTTTVRLSTSRLSHTGPIQLFNTGQRSSANSWPTSTVYRSSHDDQDYCAHLEKRGRRAKLFKIEIYSGPNVKKRKYAQMVSYSTAS